MIYKKQNLKQGQENSENAVEDQKYNHDASMLPFQQLRLFLTKIKLI